MAVSSSAIIHSVQGQISDPHSPHEGEYTGICPFWFQNMRFYWYKNVTRFPFADSEIIIIIILTFLAQSCVEINV